MPKRIPTACAKCDMMLPSKAVRETHLVWHQGYLENLCSLCGDAVGSNEQLDQHKSAHRAGKLAVIGLRATPASYKPTIKANKAPHVLSELTTKNHFCKTCNRGFVASHNMYNHAEKIHQDFSYRPYVCQFCGKRYESTGWKMRHEKCCAAVKLPTTAHPPPSMLDMQLQEAGTSSLRQSQHLETIPWNLTTSFGPETINAQAGTVAISSPALPPTPTNAQWGIPAETVIPLERKGDAETEQGFGVLADLPE